MPEITKAATDYLSVRLPVDLLDKIQEMALDERRTLSFMARILIEEAAAARAKKAAKNGK